MSEMEDPTILELPPVEDGPTEALRYQECFVRLAADNQQRTDRVQAEFDAEAVELEIESNTRVNYAGRAMKFYSGATYPRFVLNCVLNAPDAWIPTNQLTAIWGYPPQMTINNQNAPFELPIYEYTTVGRNGYYRLAPYIVLRDSRDEATYQQTGKARSRPDPYPVLSVVEPGIPDVGARVDSVLKFDDERIVRKRRPERLIRILNIDDVNQQTRDFAAFLASRNGNGASAQLNRFVFLDDQRSEFNRNPYEIGPFPRRVLHYLLQRYLTKEVLEVGELGHSVTSSDWRESQRFLQSLALRGMISVKHNDVNGIQVIGKARLRPVIFEEQRLPYATPLPSSD